MKLRESDTDGYTSHSWTVNITPKSYKTVRPALLVIMISILMVGFSYLGMTYARGFFIQSNFRLILFLILTFLLSVFVSALLLNTIWKLLFPHAATKELKLSGNALLLDDQIFILYQDIKQCQVYKIKHTDPVDPMSFNRYYLQIKSAQNTFLIGLADDVGLGNTGQQFTEHMCDAISKQMENIKTNEV